jgi:hypothetical protein
VSTLEGNLGNATAFFFGHVTDNLGDDQSPSPFFLHPEPVEG